MEMGLVATVHKSRMLCSAGYAKYFFMFPAVPESKLIAPNPQYARLGGTTTSCHSTDKLSKLPTTI